MIKYVFFSFTIDENRDNWKIDRTITVVSPKDKTIGVLITKVLLCWKPLLSKILKLLLNCKSGKNEAAIVGIFIFISIPYNLAYYLRRCTNRTFWLTANQQNMILYKRIYLWSEGFVKLKHVVVKKFSFYAWIKHCNTYDMGSLF